MQDPRELRPVRVLIVDDDFVMRAILEAVLASDPLIEVVGEAASAEEARGAIKILKPDVVTLDVMMSGMNGLDFLDKIMELHPMPVVMVSGLTTSGADATIRALEAGAVECVAKPSSGSAYAFEDLAGIVKVAANARVRRKVARPPARLTVPGRSASAYAEGGKIVAIGSSTGGVDALIEVLSEFPANCPPTVVVQHMPAQFTRSLAARLDRLSAASIHEAADDAPLEQGCVYLAPGGATHLEVVGSRGLRCRLREGDKTSGHRPSVDALFMSVREAAGANAIGVILTGMGRDGAAGLLAMREAGARTFGQDEATSLIYGMPKVAFELGAVERQLPLPRIGRAILTTAAVRRSA